MATDFVSENREGAPCFSCESTQQPGADVPLRSHELLLCRRSVPRQTEDAHRSSDLCRANAGDNHATHATHFRDGENAIRSGRVYHRSGYATTFWRPIPQLRGRSARG
jgi:hypothetical protein